MANFSRVLAIAFLALLVQVGAFAQGVTTSSLAGKIVDTSGEPLIGANVIAVHQPSGTTYGTSTDLEGNYRIPGMRVGGPYTITSTYTGYGEQQLENVFLRLGETQRRNFTLDESATVLESVVVSATAGIPGQNAGTGTQITTDDIDNLPTLDRDINDFTRLTPQFNSTGSGASFAGVNNRFNAIYVDGAVNNDVFGLASSGTNGGQIGISPFSIDIIDQIQVVLSPYDVTLGGFAGGGINAVTKSGTNEFKGTAYYFNQNEGLAGKTNSVQAEKTGVDRRSLPEFSENLYGFSLGGPIVKDKVFFFTNVEIENQESPSAFDIGAYEGVSGANELNNLRQFLIDEYGYDPGSFGDVVRELQGFKFFGKLDINLNESNKLTLRHNYTRGESTSPGRSDFDDINFANSGIFFPSVTNSSALELNSRFGNKFSNNLIIGYTAVRDDRDPIGGDFPYVAIEDGDGDIQFGSEQFSTANALDQDILSITDNFKIYSGNHTFTIGTHNEFYRIYNLFIRQNYGSYDWDSLDDFLNGTPAVEYDRSYSLVDDITGDGSAAAAEFNAIQLGFYAQDEWSVTPDFTLTAGLRVDIPIITDDPVEDTYFNNTALPAIEQFYDLEGTRAGQAPDGQLMWSPRIGFNYDISGTNKTVLRGGLGVFTSRIPFVWPGAMFNNNGLSIGGLDEDDVDGDIFFEPSIDNQLTNPNFSVPAGQMDLFAKDFKYPQVFRTNLALDTELPGGIQATFEGLYTKTLNNVIYTNVNNDPTVDFAFTGAGNDDREVLNRNSIDPTYTAVYLADNTNEGYTYNLSATFNKKFESGLNVMLAYNYGDGESINEGTSSQNSSQWRGQINVAGRNNPVLGRTDFSVGHRIVGALTYKLNWDDQNLNATTFSLFYNGQSGSPFSYVIGARAGQNIINERGSTGRNRTLAYIPANQSEIALENPEDWAILNAFIEDSDYLSGRRGDYAEKNGDRAPWTSLFDFAIRQDFGIKVGNTTQKFQLSLDVFNFANLLNSEWGVVYRNPFTFELVDFEGFDGTVPTYSVSANRLELGNDKFDFADTASRWRMRLGVRYIFN